MAKWERGLMEMWASVPKKSKLGIFYVVYNINVYFLQ